MPLDQVGMAVQRVKAVMERRPDMGVHADSLAVARWDKGTRVVASHAGGQEVVTDMPVELGGAGDRVTPGWLFRAGVAACATTSIALAAANAGIELTQLEVHVTSRSDTRGLLNMTEPNGEPVYAGPFDVEMHVTVAANDTTPEAMETLIAKCLKHSPIPSALTTATPFALHVNVTPT